MFSSSAPETPRKGDPEAFNEVVRGLNEKHQLQLVFVDVQLTPHQRRRRIEQGGPDQKRLEQIRRHLHKLFCDKIDDPLPKILENFDHAAAGIHQQWADRSRTTRGSAGTTRHANDESPVISRGEVVHLQDTLLSLLTGSCQSPAPMAMTQSFDSKMRTPLPATADRPKSVKRTSNDMPPEFSVKRARNSQQGTSGNSNIPLRPTNAFSARSQQPSSSQVQSTDSEDEQYNTAPESPSRPHTPTAAPAPLGGMFNAIPRGTPGDDSDDSDASPTGSNPVPLSPSIRMSFNVNDSLRGIWPILPPCLTHAPLGVCWEVTRIALHCNVPLNVVKNLKYDETWHDQNTMRRTLQAHPLFRGKTFPQPCGPGAWEASLTTFQEQRGMAISLALALTWRKEHTGPLFQVSLQPLKLELSHRLGRRFGADRFLEINIPSPTSRDRYEFVNDDAADKIIHWLATGRHHIVGRQWMPFWVRNEKKPEKKDKREDETRTIAAEDKFTRLERVYCFAGDGNEFSNYLEPNGNDISSNPGIPSKEQATTLGERSKMKLTDMLDWALSIRKPANQQQPTLKLFSRLALSLSRTRDAVVIEPHQIRHHAQDILSPEGNVMNDGIARMSTAMVKLISENLGLEEIPSAFQGRFGSAKGLWIRDVADVSDDLWIETYPSQRKWDCDFDDADHRSFDVKAHARPLKSADINLQFIDVLCARARNRIQMRETIAGFLTKWLEEELEQQRAAMADPVLLAQWVHDNFFQSYRAGRSTGSVDFLGGLPDGEAETLNFLLAAGFHPMQQRFLRDLFWNLAERKAENLKRTLKIRIPRSAYAFMAVDFQGVLQPGEVHLTFSSKFKVDNNPETLLDGFDVLVARAPAHFPSDI